MKKGPEEDAKEQPTMDFHDLIGHVLNVDCKSWPEKFALKTWGPSFPTKTTPGEITSVKSSRKTKDPVFEVYFKDTEQLIGKLDLDYILKYSDEVPLKYHTLKAEYIVRKAKEAGQLQTATKCSENTQADSNNSATTVETESNGNNKVHSKQTPRAGMHLANILIFRSAFMPDTFLSPSQLADLRRKNPRKRRKVTHPNYMRLTTVKLRRMKMNLVPVMKNLLVKAVNQNLKVI